MPDGHCKTVGCCPAPALKGMVVSLVASLLALAAVVGIGFPTAALSAERSVTIDVKPNTIALAPGGAGRQTLTVIVRPGTEMTIQTADLRFLPARGIHTSVAGQPLPSQFPTRNELIWTVEIESDGDIRGETPLTLVLEHRTGTDPLKPHTVQYDLSAVTVKPVPPPATKDVLEHGLLKDFESLFDQQTGRAYLRLTNLTDDPLSVTAASFQHPRFMNTAAAEPLPWIIPARSTSLVPLTLSFRADSQEPVVAGNHTIGAALRLEQKRGKDVWSGGVSITEKVAIGVPFISEIQNLIQIPSFLVLPGVLVLLMSSTLFQFYQRIVPDPAPVASKKAAFLQENKTAAAALSISLSLVIVAFVYPFYTQHILKQPRNVLIGYGFSDVYHMWFLSLLIGGVFAVVWVGLDLRRRRGASMKRFTPKDSPLRVIERLAALESGIRRPVCTAVTGGAKLFLLAPDTATPGKVWAVPAASLGSREADDTKRSDTLQTIHGLLNDGAVDKLANTLRRDTSIGIAWTEDQGPRLVDATLFPETARQENFIIITMTPLP